MLEASCEVENWAYPKKLSKLIPHVTQLTNLSCTNARLLPSLPNNQTSDLTLLTFYTTSSNSSPTRPLDFIRMAQPVLTASQKDKQTRSPITKVCGRV